MKAKFQELFLAVKNEKVDTVELLLEEIEKPIPELFLGLAEVKKSQPIADALVYHWTIAGGFDEEFLSPMMAMVKKGFVRATENIASVMTKENEHDFTDRDDNGLNVIDWANVMNETELSNYLEGCLENLPE